MLYGNRLNHVDLAVCFERFFFAAAAARLPMQNTNESVWPEPLFRSPLPPVRSWAFPKAVLDGKIAFRAGIFLPSSELSPMLKRRSVESFFEA